MEYSKDVRHRLNRIEGQVRGVIRLMEEQKDCKDVVTQLSAIRTAVSRAIGVIVSENLASCVKEQVEAGEDTSAVVKEAIQLLTKSQT